jgi:hypothetical protein
VDKAVQNINNALQNININASPAKDKEDFVEYTFQGFYREFEFLPADTAVIRKAAIGEATLTF